MGMEYEKKFRCDQTKQQAILAALGGRRETISMATTYFDTPTGALSARKWTLRCRKENDRFICTLKTPAQGNARREWETEEKDILKSIDKLCILDTPQELRHLCQTGVIPICGAEFSRIAITLTFGESILEIALDAGVLTGGGKMAPIAELEVELKSGSTADADAFAAELAENFGLTEEPKSKFARALALYRGE